VKAPATMADIAAAMESSVATADIGMLYLCAQQNQLRNNFTFGCRPPARGISASDDSAHVNKRGKTFL
jgi:hypothetical protein